MNIKSKIETARDALNNAVNMQMNREIILEMSQMIDEYIVEYYRQSRKVGSDQMLKLPPSR
jgi:hypothetical protein